MQLSEITPVILTLNEEANIGRCLARLDWASRVLVVDSGSTDSTETLVRNTPHGDWIERPFDSHARQWNFAVSQAETDWVLTLDADYLVTRQWVREVEALEPGANVAFETPFVYRIYGRPLRGSLYPPRPVLFRPADCRYSDDGHTQRLEISGKCSRLQSHFYHDDRKPLADWILSQRRYTRLEAEKLLSAGQNLDWPDRLRRLAGPAILITPFYCLIGKRLLLDGWPGWYYTLQRTLAEILLSLEILERRFRVLDP